MWIALADAKVEAQAASCEDTNGSFKTGEDRRVRGEESRGEERREKKRAEESGHSLNSRRGGTACDEKVIEGK
uniref:Uncharacterized protein n=1 Tax=Chromera velia CCMP2878 TaxID=1169474 RepID=A0A0G4F9Z7_9ALVE|eukprot:Cvel_15800.t1-p1 / transcript=Cvel_15800.t1 / gene=Cvel_15800 / organism=Chromera_velia_CCMP2878 / gene_product=hypothetical protein / transcript_product=hypothetical protein / location=Cvel_scaffold1186:28887-29378(+) / protein_length=72 / sequence_SO=supercontig / SO=protein_coding / is_pseudo=false